MDIGTETKIYETDYILKGDLGEEKAWEIGESLRGLIENGQGIVIQESKPQKQNLGYPIKKHSSCYFGAFKFIFSVDKINSLKINFGRLDLLRLLLVAAKNEKETNQSRFKRRIRQPADRHIVATAKKNSTAKEETAANKPTSPPSSNEPLQVEALDKKLEEILGK